MTPVCGNCGKKDSLYKEFDNDGRVVLLCIQCNWKSEPFEHHQGLLHIEDIKKASQNWQ